MSPQIAIAGRNEKNVRLILLIPISSGGPGIGDRPSIPLFGGQDIEVEGREIFQARIGFFQVSVIDRLDVPMASIAEIDAEGLLSLATEISQGFLILIVAGRAAQPIDSPLITAEGANEITPSLLSLQQTQGGKGTTAGQRPFRKVSGSSSPRSCSTPASIEGRMLLWMKNGKIVSSNPDSTAICPIFSPFTPHRTGSSGQYFFSRERP